MSDLASNVNVGSAIGTSGHGTNTLNVDIHRYTDKIHRYTDKIHRYTDKIHIITELGKFKEYLYVKGNYKEIKQPYIFVLQMKLTASDEQTKPI